MRFFLPLLSPPGPSRRTSLRQCLIHTDSSPAQNNIVHNTEEAFDSKLAILPGIFLLGTVNGLLQSSGWLHTSSEYFDNSPLAVFLFLISLVLEMVDLYEKCNYLLPFFDHSLIIEKFEEGCFLQSLFSNKTTSVHFPVAFETHLMETSETSYYSKHFGAIF